MAREAPFKDRWIRRIRIASGRAWHTLPGMAPKSPSVYLHLPKCGGTSLSEAMYSTVPFQQRIGVIDALSTRRSAAIQNFNLNDANKCHEDFEYGQHTFDFRNGLLLQHMAWDTFLIHGHVLWSEQSDTHFKDKFKFVTLMRDPVARTISNFKMVQRAGLIGEDVDEYLESPVARRQARVYLRYLSGSNDLSDEDTPAATDLAIERLQHFAVIGFLEDLDKFAQNYRAVFGVKLKMARLNAAPKTTANFSDAQLQKFSELCEPDLKIWQAAKSIFDGA